LTPKKNFFKAFLEVNNDSGLFDQNWRDSLETIKARSEALISFNKLTLRATIGAIRPEAQFLFSNLNHIIMQTLPASSDHFSSVCATIQEFKKLSFFSKSFSIELHLSRNEMRENGLILLEKFEPLLPIPVSVVSMQQLLSTTSHSQLKSLSILWSTLVKLVPSLIRYNCKSTLSDSNELVSESPWPLLSELTISRYDQTRIDGRIIRTFPQLIKLVIYFSKDTKYIDIDDDAFAGAAHLNSFSLNHSRVCRFTGKTFRGLVNLKRLKIRLDSNESIQKLRWLSQLEELDLSCSSIDQINSNSFSYLPRLQKLDLSYCSIRKIDPYAFNRLLNLQELDLSGNTNLTTIELSRFVPRILKVDDIDSLCLLRLYESNKKKTGIEELSSLNCNCRCADALVDISPHLLHNTKNLAVQLRRQMPFNPFASLENLDLSVHYVRMIKRAGLASLSCLKQLQLRFEYIIS
jgi:hypothetical protein